MPSDDHPSPDTPAQPQSAPVRPVVARRRASGAPAFHMGTRDPKPAAPGSLSAFIEADAGRGPRA